MQRYGYDGWTGLIYPAADGDYVLHSEAQAEIERLRKELAEAEQRGYAKAMEAERILYDNSLNIAMRDAHNNAIEAAATWCENHGLATGMKAKGPYAGYISIDPTGHGNIFEGLGYAAAIRALKRPVAEGDKA